MGTEWEPAVNHELLYRFKFQRRVVEPGAQSVALVCGVLECAFEDV